MHGFRCRLTTSAVLFCAWLLSVGHAVAAEAARLPNIVFILADDMGSGDPGCYNKDSKIPTPHLDLLAAAGMRFTDAHSPSSVCTPTRYGILTGRYCWRTKLKQGVLIGNDPLLIEPDRLTVPALLRKHGYATGCVGKWHLGLGSVKPTDYAQPLKPGPNSVGFDYFFGIPASLDMPPYVYVENERCVEQPTAAAENLPVRGHMFWRGGAIAPSFKHVDVLPKITEKAVAFIESQAKADKPFFLYFPLNAPHTPWVPTKEFEGKSNVSWYGDFTMQTDAVVGQVLDALDRLKLADNTLVIFTSDNGAHWLPEEIKQYDHRANGPYRGQKADAWEGGHRVPFIVRWPGQIKPGVVSQQTICLTDLMASCADLVGAKLPDDAGEDSFSFLPLLRGVDKPTRPATVHHSANALFAIRQGDWKLIDGLGSGGFSNPKTEKPQPSGPTGQLYSLRDDLAEQKNLYAEQPEVVTKLKGLLEQTKKDGRSR